MNLQSDTFYFLIRLMQHYFSIEFHYYHHHHHHHRHRHHSIYPLNLLFVLQDLYKTHIREYI